MESLASVSISKIDRVIFWLLLIVCAITPLIIMAGRYELISPLVSSERLLASGDRWDIFTYYKAFFMLVMTGIIAILFIVKIIFQHQPLLSTRLNYVFALFIIMILLSTILSPNITVAMDGLFGRFDGGIRWVCYVILAFVAINIRYPQHVIRYFAFALYPLVIVNCMMISMNFAGYDLLQYNWVRNALFWYFPLFNSFTDSSIILGTMNQWNFMSGMFGIMTVFFLTMTIVETSKWIAASHFTVACIAMVVTLLSVSTSGFVSIMGIVFLLVMYSLKSKERRRNLTIVAMFVVLFISSSYILSIKDERVWAESFGFLTIDNLKSVFLNDGDTKPLMKESKEFSIPELPERGVSAGSGRTYIWIKTLEVVQDRPLMGYGLDSLLYNFPHFSIDARAGMYDEYTLVDKPHNTFLGVLYGTGIIGFLAYFIIFSTIVICAWRAIMNKLPKIVLPFAIASLAFFLQGIFNDSTPEIATTSWVLIGITLALSFNPSAIAPVTQTETTESEHSPTTI